MLLLALHGQLQISIVMETDGTSSLPPQQPYQYSALNALLHINASDPASGEGQRCRLSLTIHLPSSSDCEAAAAAAAAEEEVNAPTSSFQQLPYQKVYFYSAYYDDRVAQVKFIRIFSLLSSSFSSSLFCHLPLTATRFVSTPANSYEMCENHGKFFGGWILSCSVPPEFEERSRPCYVIISKRSTHQPGDDEAANNYSVRLTVQQFRPSKRSPAKNIGVCVSPLFGNVPVQTLVQFVEFTKLLGANEVMFYAKQLSSDTRKAMCHYNWAKEVSVYNWSVPVDDSAVWYHGQLLAINDCLYRNMYRFHYLIFLDLDEFLIPQRHVTWRAMLRDLESTNASDRTRENRSFDGFSFKSAFFSPFVEEENNPLLFDVGSDLRSSTFSRVRSKVIVKPTKIYELGIHHVSKTTADNNRANILDVSPEMAYIYHYRQCTTEYDSELRCRNYTRDERVSKLYLTQLVANVNKSLEIIKSISN